MAGEIQIGGTTFATESGGTVTVSNVDSATNRTNLGLGSIATQAADSVSISGGNITGGTIGSGVVFPAGVVIGMAFLADVTNGTGGASSTSATLRKLNTTIFSINCPLTISSNEFSFDETGTYVINASAPSYAANRHILRLSDDSGSTFIGVGSTEYTSSSNNVVTRSFLCKNVTVSASQITGGGSQRNFGFYHIVDNTDANGFGVSNDDTTTEQFLQVQIFRLA